jgi:hypothetical protein
MLIHAYRVEAAFRSAFQPVGDIVVPLFAVMRHTAEISAIFQ